MRQFETFRPSGPIRAGHPTSGILFLLSNGIAEIEEFFDEGVGGG